jgi:hypothetical protein
MTIIESSTKEKKMNPKGKSRYGEDWTKTPKE